MSVNALNFAAVTAWVNLGYNNAYLVAAMVSAPIVYLFFGWLYFRPGFAWKLSARIKHAIPWVALDLLAGMGFLAYLEGAEPLDMFSYASLALESANFLALMVAGYLAKPSPLPRSRGASRPSSVPPRQGPA